MRLKPGSVHQNRAQATLKALYSIPMSSNPIDSGHTAWILTSMALVQLMLPGLAFFYAGLLHRTSVSARRCVLSVPIAQTTQLSHVLARPR